MANRLAGANRQGGRGWGNAGQPPGWPQLRRLVAARDHMTCQRCGRQVHSPRCRPGGCDLCLHVAHIIPRAEGGQDTMENCRVECQRDNLMDAAEWRRRDRLGQTTPPPRWPPLPVW